ncbi:MAG: hypothetical protein M1831_006087 [Alyxoria varia]|nr:MAG: hypothetical protein M1831_006087 [Alyxoria varia]
MSPRRRFSSAAQTLLPPVAKKNHAGSFRIILVIAACFTAAIVFTIFSAPSYGFYRTAAIPYSTSNKTINAKAPYGNVAKLSSSAQTLGFQAQSTQSKTSWFSPSSWPFGEKELNKTVVLASYFGQNVTWIDEDMPEGWQAVRYIMDDPDPHHQLTVYRNQGRESMPYLTFIIDNYDHFPDVAVFSHGHLRAWHQPERLTSKLRYLNIDSLRQWGYLSLRCYFPTCYEDGAIDIDEAAGPREQKIPFLFRLLFPHGDPVTGLMQYPRMARFSGTAQFAVTKEAVYQRSKEDWEMIRRPLMRDISDIRGMEDVQGGGNYLFGLLYEMMWHILMGLREYCPGETRCREEFFQDAVHCDFEPTGYPDWLSNRTKNFNCSDARPGELEFPKWPENIEKDREETERETEQERVKKAMQQSRNNTLSRGGHAVKKITSSKSGGSKTAGEERVKGSSKSKAKSLSKSKPGSHSSGSSSSKGKPSSSNGNKKNYKEEKPRKTGQKIKDKEEDVEEEEEDDGEPKKETQKENDEEVEEDDEDEEEDADADAEEESSNSGKQTKIHPYDKQSSGKGGGDSKGSSTSKKHSSSEGGKSDEDKSTTSKAKSISKNQSKSKDGSKDDSQRSTSDKKSKADSEKSERGSKRPTALKPHPPKRNAESESLKSYIVKTQQSGDDDDDDDDDDDARQQQQQQEGQKKKTSKQPKVNHKILHR